MTDTTHTTLSNGVTMPTVGLGVFKAGAGEGTRGAVSAALDAGYRHVDTAAIYRNEAEVGEAVRAWCQTRGVAREEVFVTTKLWNDDHGYDAARRAFDASLERLGLGYVDQYLIHWPVPELRLESWRALERTYADGRARSIGVSNYMPHHLDELERACEVLPHVNQIELHPFLPQRDAVAWCRDRGVQTVAYSPLTKGRLLDDPRVLEVGARLGVTAAQVLLRWGLEQGHVVLPKSSNPGRIAQNIDVFGFALGEEARAALDALGEEGRRTAWDPTGVG
jgi:diketogulonate reductase-like aldo/keto reductase